MVDDLVIIEGEKKIAFLTEVFASTNVRMKVRVGDHKGSYYLKFSVLVKLMAESEYKICVVGG